MLEAPFPPLCIYPLSPTTNCSLARSPRRHLTRRMFTGQGRRPGRSPSAKKQLKRWGGSGQDAPEGGQAPVRAGKLARERHGTHICEAVAVHTAMRSDSIAWFRCSTIHPGGDNSPAYPP